MLSHACMLVILLFLFVCTTVLYEMRMHGTVSMNFCDVDLVASPSCQDGDGWFVVSGQIHGTRGPSIWCVGMLHLAHWDRGKLRPASIDISPTAQQTCLRHPAPVLPCKVLQISIYLVLAG